MDLKNILPVHHILLPLQAGNAQDAIFELVTPLAGAGIITDAKRFCKDIWRREEQITTQVEFGVAFPHARSETVRRLALTMGICADPGLVFNPEAAEPCRIFFLLAIPTFAPAAHLPLLQRLVVYVNDPVRRKRLLESRTPGQITKSIYSFKGKAG